jgi:2-polyprenyl-6-methoxyphenol hydroxylase-like FAD-dependent oxidoreductase
MLVFCGTFPGREDVMPGSNSYDLVVVGGGIAGASLGKNMAEAGVRVLILEASKSFTDRVRGEGLLSWGVAEADSLGLNDAFEEAGANKFRWANNYLGSQQTEHRDLPLTTLTKTPSLSFYHPKMQTCVLQAAERAGAEVRRGVEASAVVGGFPARVKCDGNGRSEEISARMVVIADGRNSRLRKQLGFEVQRETHSGCIAGVLFEGVALPDDTLQWFINPALGEAIGWLPQGESRVRTYLCFWGERKQRLQGAQDVGRLMRDLEWTGVAGELFAKAQAAGPLATFEAADFWVEEPYKDGVALLGDTAASNDPTWGQGLSLALRGSRTLRDVLLSESDWNKAGHNYVREYQRYYGNVRMVIGWLREFFLETGEAADVRRARAFPLFAEDPTRVPDLLLSGPEIPLNANSKARFFCEDAA